MTTYNVVAGDNLTKIAKRFNTSVEELARKNNISDPNKIFIGQQLTIKETEQQTQPQPQNQEDLTNQLKSMQKQLNDMQNKMNHQENESLNGWEVFGLGLGAYGTGKVIEKATPYAIKGSKATAKAVVQGAKTIASAAQNTGKSITKVVKHSAKKLELEYAFAKDAVKTASKNGSNILKVGKAGKALGKVAAPVAAAVTAVEVYDAYKTEGSKGAIKQGAKCASGLACAAAGAKIGAVIGACTGPAAPIAVPVLTLVGSVAGYLGGEKIANKLISLFS